MKTLLDSLLDATAPDDAPFCQFIQGGQVVSVTRGMLRKESLRYAALLEQNGVEAGQVVVIILRHSPDLFSAFIGAMIIGAIPSFMPPATTKQDLKLYWSSHRSLFQRIGAVILLTYRANLPEIESNLGGIELTLIEAEQVKGIEPRSAALSTDSNQIAFLQHSSGTTGLKKGVALTHASVLSQIETYASSLWLGPNDRIVSWLPLYHDMGLITSFLVPLVTGIEVVLLDPLEWVVNPRTLFDAIKTYRGTLCWQPNFAFHHLSRAVGTLSGFDLSSMRAWIDCSEPCRPESFTLFEKTFSPAGVNSSQLQVCYAMAETVFAVTQTELGREVRTLTKTQSARAPSDANADQAAQTTDLERHYLSTGYPVAGVELRIVGPAGQLLPEGEIGEIAVRGPSLFSGYYKLEDETSRKLRDGWYYTADLGFLDQGELFVTGRKADLIIVHGRNYYAHELEYIISAVEGVHPGRNVALGWFRKNVGSEDVVVIAERKTNTELNDHLLIRRIKQALIDQAGLLPFDVQTVEPGWLVKTTSGKLSRIENLNKYLGTLAKSA